MPAAILGPHSSPLNSRPHSFGRKLTSVNKKFVALAPVPPAVVIEIGPVLAVLE
jgi:hypothetical protein